MSSIALLANQLYGEEVARARSMQPGDKPLEGARLFDRACRLMAEGIRHQHPELDWAYLRRWSTAHGTLALLEDIRDSIPAI